MVEQMQLDRACAKPRHRRVRREAVAQPHPAILFGHRVAFQPAQLVLAGGEKQRACVYDVIIVEQNFAGSRRGSRADSAQDRGAFGLSAREQQVVEPVARKTHGWVRQCRLARAIPGENRHAIDPMSAELALIEAQGVELRQRPPA